MYSSGLRGSPAKGIGRETDADVQIISYPPDNHAYAQGCKHTKIVF